MEKELLSELKANLQEKSKKGVDFILSALIIWLIFFFIWNMEISHMGKSLYSFIFGAFLIPFAFLFSKLFKTDWNLKRNPLVPLGLCLNFAQLIYFPFLFFFYSRDPSHFILAYAIITGAHLFPYFWLYDTKSYAIISILIAWGSFGIFSVYEEQSHVIIPFFTSLCFLILGIWLKIEGKSVKKQMNGVNSV